jgi:hypothetical protein
MPTRRLPVLTGEGYFGCSLEAFARSKLVPIARRDGLALPGLAEVANAEPIIATVHEGRWIVSCPDCRTDHQIAFDQDALYMCANCWNESLGGEWRRVAFPVEREAIEAVLMERRRRVHQNWTAGESLVELREQNQALAPEGIV